MRLLQVWREARGRRLENELNDLLAHVDSMSTLAKSVCFNNIWATHEYLVAAYDSLPVPDRKLLIRSLRKGASKMWKQGRRPTAIGLGIVLLNIESRHTPGESAAAVLERTNAIIVAASK
jgi:hypothetical protein